MNRVCGRDGPLLLIVYFVKLLLIIRMYGNLNMVKYVLHQ